jgi:hypothetical protein
MLKQGSAVLSLEHLPFPQCMVFVTEEVILSGQIFIAQFILNSQDFLQPSFILLITII